jgi:hypothetical protein
MVRVPIFAVALAICVIFAGRAYSANSCSGECSADYRADVSTCQQIGAEDSCGDNQACAQEASDDHDACLRDCSDPLSLNLNRKTRES